ncbi:hypothetical protein BGZ72_001125 [Mortierella alpina]|nr:hypothetical protein BGZ72_001125 [Mortierella alpina]
MSTEYKTQQPMSAPAPAYGYPPVQQGPPSHAPAQNRRDQDAINSYQQEIKENEINITDIAWFVCCGPLALICCLPKYNKTQEAKMKLDIELAKPL